MSRSGWMKLPIRALNGPRFPFLRGLLPACFCGFCGGFSEILLFLPGLAGRGHYRGEKPARTELVFGEVGVVFPDSGFGGWGAGKGGLWIYGGEWTKLSAVKKLLVF